MDIAIAVLVGVLILLVEHYLPWSKLVGRELPRPAAYILGVLAMIVPLSALYIWWHYRSVVLGWRPIEWYWAVVAMWAVVIGCGLAVLGAYALDSWLEYRMRLAIAEREADHLRPEV